MSNMEYKFSELFSWQSGKPVVLNDGEIPVYGSNGIVGYTHLAKFKNKIILGRVGAYCGSVEYCSKEFNATDNTLVTTCDESKILYQYAFYLLNQYKLNKYAGGSAQPLITQGVLKHLKCDIPNIETQSQITNILLSYDNLIENNKKRIKILEQMAEEIYKEWFVRWRFPGYEDKKIENSIPQGWHLQKIKTLVKRLPFGITYKESEVNQEGETIVIDQSSKLFLGYHDNEPSHIASYEKPILLFGDHSCKYQLMTTNFSLGENIIPYVSIDDDRINRYYLFYATRNILTTEEYKRHWNRFINMKILVPDIDLQVLFQKKVMVLNMQINKLLKINRNLIKQRDLLLPRLMSGKLEVK